MIIDTSALVAIALKEHDAGDFEKKLAGASVPLMSVASLLEATMVLESRAGPSASTLLDALTVRFDIQLVPVTTGQVEVARVAWREFGKGNHPAGLNFGDCFTYALAKITGEPLLFKGNDFSRTDIKPA